MLRENNKQMHETELSIIIPVYNVEEYLAQCLDSVFSQFLNACEVVCVNDGSIDGSRDILYDYKKQYSELIIIDRKNGGLSAARNTGLKRAKGKFVYFLDSDDYLLPGVLNKMYEFAAHTDLDIACFNSKIGLNKLYFYIKEKMEGIYQGEDFYVSFQQNNGFPPVSPVWMYIYRNEFLKKNNLSFKEGRIHEDELFTPFALLSAMRVSILDTPILFHRVFRKDAITTGFKLQNQISRIETCRDLYTVYKKNIKNRDLFLQSIFNIYDSVAQKIISTDLNFRNKIFSPKDYKIWRQCVVERDYYSSYFFFRYMPILYKWNKDNSHARFLQKSVKIFFRLLYKLSSY